MNKHSYLSGTHKKAALYHTALTFLKNEHDAIEAVHMINYCQDILKKKKRFISKESLQQNIAIYDSKLLIVEEEIAIFLSELLDEAATVKIQLE